mmetsp:Transcript_9431/g.35130  ORF Transcript_9431/g.35130 Transcript_9431/m.35130 type:complete len:227 (+) Transcript_9431:547-1227(+)
MSSASFLPTMTLPIPSFLSFWVSFAFFSVAFFSVFSALASFLNRFASSFASIAANSVAALARSWFTSVRILVSKPPTGSSSTVPTALAFAASFANSSFCFSMRSRRNRSRSSSSFFKSSISSADPGVTIREFPPFSEFVSSNTERTLAFPNVVTVVSSSSASSPKESKLSFLVSFGFFFRESVSSFFSVFTRAATSSNGFQSTSVCKILGNGSSTGRSPSTSISPI